MKNIVLIASAAIIAATGAASANEDINLALDENSSSIVQAYNFTDHGFDGRASSGDAAHDLELALQENGATIVERVQDNTVSGRASSGVITFDASVYED